MLLNCGAGEDSLRVPWTAKISNQSTPKEINPEYSLEGLMLKQKLQYFGHMMWRAGLLEKTLMLGKIEGRRRRAQLSPTLCDPMECSLPGSSVHGLLQARILEWVAISYSRGSSRSMDQTQVSCIAGRFFTLWATKETFLLRDLTAKFVTTMSSSLWEIGKEETSPHRMIYTYFIDLAFLRTTIAVAAMDTFTFNLKVQPEGRRRGQ